MDLGSLFTLSYVSGPEGIEDSFILIADYLRIVDGVSGKLHRMLYYEIVLKKRVLDLGVLRCVIDDSVETSGKSFEFRDVACRIIEFDETVYLLKYVHLIHGDPLKCPAHRLRIEEVLHGKDIVEHPVVYISYECATVGYQFHIAVSCKLIYNFSERRSGKRILFTQFLLDKPLTGLELTAQNCSLYLFPCFFSRVTAVGIIVI